MTISRRQVLSGAASLAAMTAASAIAVVAQAPLAGWAFSVSSFSRKYLARLPLDARSDAAQLTLFQLFDDTQFTREATGPHLWIAVNIVDGKLRVVGDETWSYRRACIDAGWQVEALS